MEIEGCNPMAQVKLSLMESAWLGESQPWIILSLRTLGADNPKTRPLWCKWMLAMNRDLLRHCPQKLILNSNSNQPIILNPLVSLHQSMVMSIEVKEVKLETKKDRAPTNVLWIAKRTNKVYPWKSQTWIAWSRLERKSRKWSTMTNSYTVQTRRDRSSASKCSRDWMPVSCPVGSLMAFFCCTRAVWNFLTRPSDLNLLEWISTMLLKKTLSSSKIWLTWIYQTIAWICTSCSTLCPCKNWICSITTSTNCN